MHARNCRIAPVHLSTQTRALVFLGVLATAMSWILGSALVGFTMMQLRLLKRMEFRAAREM